MHLPAVMPPALLPQQVWRGAPAPVLVGARTPVTTGAVARWVVLWPRRAAVKVRREGRAAMIGRPAPIGLTPWVRVDVVVAVALIVRPVEI